MRRAFTVDSLGSGICVSFHISQGRTHEICLSSLLFGVLHGKHRSLSCLVWILSICYVYTNFSIIIAFYFNWRFFRCVTNNSSDNPFLYYGAAGGQVLAFLLAIAFLLIYYKYCHPSLMNRTKVPSLDSDCLEADKPGFSKSYSVRTGSWSIVYV